MPLWADPYYPFAINNKMASKPIVVDVTRSAQNFDSEIAGLADIITDFRDRDVEQICDLGAGKLRNTLFLLREGFTVCAVEHDLTFQRPQGHERLAKAKRFTRFSYVTPS